MSQEHAAAEVEEVAPALEFSKVLPFVAVAAVLLAALVYYWPSLDAPLFADDYMYIQAARDHPTGEFLKDAFVPGSTNEDLYFSSAYYRPLFFVSFLVLEPLFGASPAGYHVVNTLSHLALVVLVALLGWRLFDTPWAGAVAAGLFAVYPLGYDSVAWISSLNSLAYPLAIAAWLTFIAATHSKDHAAALHAATAGLLILSGGFREAGLTVVAAMISWYLLVAARDRLREPATWYPLVPMAAIASFFAVVGIVVQESFAPRQTTLFSWTAIEQGWEYVTWLVLPGVSDDPTFLAVQRLMAVAFLVAGIGCAILRRWTLVSLYIGCVAAIAPFTTGSLGTHERYLYWPAVFAALIFAGLLVEVLRAAPGRYALAGRYVAAVGVVSLVVLSMLAGRYRLENWIEDNPEQHQAWVDQFRAAHPTIPPGTDVYVTGGPLVVALFDGLVVPATVRLHYPDVGEVIYYDSTDPNDVRPTPGSIAFEFVPPE